MLPILKQEHVDEPPCVLNVTATKLDVVIEGENDIIKREQIDDYEPGFSGVKMEPVWMRLWMKCFMMLKW